MPENEQDRLASTLFGPIAPSPTGAPRIPVEWVPYIQLASSVCVALAAQFGLPGPWTPERYLTVAGIILSILIGSSSAGNRAR